MNEERERSAYPAANYYYRRELRARDLVPAVAVGVGAGLVAFYIARLLLQRTPLRRAETVPVVGRRGTVVRRSARAASVGS